MKNRVLAFVFAVILAVAAYPATVVNAVDGEPVITILSAEVDVGGSFEVIGHVEGVEVGTQVSFIMCDISVFDSTGHIIESQFTNSDIAYIDQVGTGNNGVFIVQGAVDSSWRGKTVRFAGASQYGGYYTDTFKIATDPPGIEIIQSNSVMYGRDAYLITGTYYKPNNIATSIKEGGNRIYYKLGGKWYDLLDPEALDNSYLVAENAMIESDVEACNPRYYYTATQITLKYN